MKAYHFKFDDGKSDSHYQGIVVSEDLYDLFWLMDEFGDPYSAKFITAGKYSVGLCIKITENDDLDDEGNVTFEQSEWEMGGCLPLRDDDRWECIDWPDIKELFRNKK